MKVIGNRTLQWWRIRDIDAASGRLFLVELAAGPQPTRRVRISAEDVVGSHPFLSEPGAWCKSPPDQRRAYALAVAGGMRDALVPIALEVDTARLGSARFWRPATLFAFEPVLDGTPVVLRVQPFARALRLWLGDFVMMPLDLRQQWIAHLNFVTPHELGQAFGAALSRATERASHTYRSGNLAFDGLIAAELVPLIELLTGIACATFADGVLHPRHLTWKLPRARQPSWLPMPAPAQRLEAISNGIVARAETLSWLEYPIDDTFLWAARSARLRLGRLAEWARATRTIPAQPWHPLELSA